MRQIISKPSINSPTARFRQDGRR